MKKRIVGWLLVAFVFAAAAGLFASAAEDYKVIKNAVQSPAASRPGGKATQWFKIAVFARNGSREKVKITLPLSLVESVLNACPEKKLRVENGCDIDIQRVWRDLKAAGPLALVEVEEEGETVKIWLE